MKCKCVKNFSWRGFQFRFDKQKQSAALARYTFGFLPRKIEVIQGERKICCRQKWNAFKIILFPLNFLHSKFWRYSLYEDGVLIGECKRKSYVPPVLHLRMHEDLYIISMHSDNCSSVMKNEVQVALFQLDKWAFAGLNEYSIDCSYQISSDILALIAAVVDVTFFPMNGKFAGISYTKTFVRFDKEKQRAKWNF